MSNQVSAEQEDAIVNVCQEHIRQSSVWNDIKPCVTFEGFFIKFADYESMYSQYMTQQYISKIAASDPNAPRIPEVYHFFTRGYKAYLVMECIELIPSTEVSDFPKRVAGAIQWLHSVPTPPKPTIGPLGGGFARHMIFQHFEAPLTFLSVEALERYMNAALLDPSSIDKPDPIHIRHEPLVFTQSNMRDTSNFGIDKKGNTCLFGLDNMGLLPQSFASYTLSDDEPFVAAVSKYLDCPASSERNLYSMGEVFSNLVMTADTTLGLDDNGMPKPMRRFARCSASETTMNVESGGNKRLRSLL